MRKTMRVIAEALATARQTTPGLLPVLSLLAIGQDKSLRMVGSVQVGATSYDVANDQGKVRTFTAVDDFVKAVAKYIPTVTGDYPVTVKTGILLVGSVPADLIKDAQSKVVKLGGVKVTQQGVVADLNAQLALMAGWDQGNPLQVAKFNEVTAQKAAVVEDIAALDALIAHYQTIAGS